LVDQRFPRSVRLRKRPDFVRIQARGRRFRTKNLVVCWSPGPSAGRFGLTVSRKVGNAVTRNRVKRWLREAIRRNRDQVQGQDVVLIALPSASRAGAQVLAEEVVLAMARIGRKESR
jgi:ribonuclease P protein component